MIQKIKLDNILFLDIETVPQAEDFEKLSETEQSLWEEKSKYKRQDAYSPKEFYNHAGIWAEFGKIICISVGYFVINPKGRNFRVRSFSGEEKEILLDFKSLLDKYFFLPKHLLCAHNGKEFDFPYIARRMLINDISLPNKLNLYGKKPWEIPHIDTLELWKFGDRKNFTSLKLMTHILGIKSPKEDIEGSQVRDFYYVEKDLNRIIKYCQRDTLAVAQLFLRFRNEELLTDQEIVFV